MEIDPEKPKARNRKFDTPNVPRDEPTSRKRHRVRGWCRRGEELVEVGAARAERRTKPQFLLLFLYQFFRQPHHQGGTLGNQFLLLMMDKQFYVCT